ncbi:MAG: hypothetical protein JWQ66_2778, partial [Mucilaginibacter sp.]|nr:hypothetical protein [Mucilaginibacter sp.]
KTGKAFTHPNYTGRNVNHHRSMATLPNARGNVVVALLFISAESGCKAEKLSAILKNYVISNKERNLVRYT